MKEAGRNSIAGIDAGDNINNGHTHLEGRALGGPGDAHKPCEALQGEIVACLVGARPVLPIARNGTVNKLGLLRTQRSGIKPKGL